jgi:hypothetical protein
MIRWLHDHVFRGFGILFLVGMITILLLAVMSQVRRAPQHSQAAPVSTGR